MNNSNINLIVKKLEELLSAEYGKAEMIGVFRSGDESYHLCKISGNESDGAITIARDYLNGRYMAEFSCKDGKLDIFFAFGAKQRSTIRWRYYFDNEYNNYTQGTFLVKKATKTMTALIAGTGVHDDAHKGHYFYTISRNMRSLTVKEIRDTLEETLFKFYSIQDWSVNPTKVMDRAKEFRVEFRIYDAEFWIDIDAGIYQVYVATRSFRGPDNIDSIHIWLDDPYQYDKNSFEFAWRKDLEVFFDAFCAALMEKFKRINAKTSSAAVYGTALKQSRRK